MLLLFMLLYLLLLYYIILYFFYLTYYNCINCTNFRLHGVACGTKVFIKEIKLHSTKHQLAAIYISRCLCGCWWANQNYYSRKLSSKSVGVENISLLFSDLALHKALSAPFT